MEAEAHPTRFVGTELGTVELLGEIDRDAPIAAAVVAAGLVEVPARTALSVVFLRMHRLRSRRLGWPRFDYGEVLWRVGGHRGDQPVWVATRCDLDSRMVGAMARRLMRYDVHRATIRIEDISDAVRRVTVEAAAGRFVVTATAGDPVTPPSPRPLLVEGGRLGLAWHEQAIGVARAATIAIEDDGGVFRGLLGPHGVVDHGVVYASREHACGVARPI